MATAELHEKGWPYCTHTPPLPAPAVVLSHCLDPLGLDRGPRYARLMANLMNVASQSRENSSTEYGNQIEYSHRTTEPDC